MTLSITIPDAIATQVVDNVCAATNYDPASGKTKPQWAREKVIEALKRFNQAGAMRLAREAQVSVGNQIS